MKMMSSLTPSLWMAAALCATVAAQDAKPRPSVGKIHVKGNAGSDLGMYMLGGEMVIDGNADVHVCTHAEGGKVIIKGNAKSKVGGQMVDGTVIIFGTIDTMMPGFKPNGETELEVEGIKTKFAHYIGDTGERHKKKKGQIIYGNLYQKI